MSDWCQFMTEPHEAAKGSEYSELPVSNGSPVMAEFWPKSPRIPEDRCFASRRLADCASFPSDGIPDNALRAWLHLHDH